MKSLAVEFAAPESVRLVQVDVPRPSAGEVLVRTSYSGISSGTEMLFYRGDLDAGTSLDESIASLSGHLRYPVRFGYSCVGVVQEAVPGLPRGSLVFCFHPHQQWFVLPVGDVVDIRGLDPREATLFPLVETALQICLDAGSPTEGLVVLLGLGAVGLLAGALMARRGAGVVASDPLGWRREVAGTLGVEAVAPVDLTESVMRRTGGLGAPLLVDASGQEEALADGLGLLAHEGEVLVASWYGSRKVALPLGGAFHRRRLTLRSTQVSTIPARLQDRWTIERRRAATRALMDELPLRLLATHDFPLEAAAEAFGSVARRAPGLIHAALRYDEA